MKVTPTDLAGVLVIEPEVFGDSRGFFLEQFNRARYEASTDSPSAVGLDAIVQINHSRSVKNTVRGLHFQEPKGQGKLVWALSGTVLDVAVDVRRGSSTFGQWTSVEISAENRLQVWVPPGYAHGFSVLSGEADFMYACTRYYAPEYEHSVRWNDPAIGIEWRVDEPLLSAKDAEAPLLAEAPGLPEYKAVMSPRRSTYS